MADKTTCVKCGATLSESDQQNPDGMKLCPNCRKATSVRAPQGSD